VNQPAITFEPLPPHRGRKRTGYVRKHAAIAALLRERPGDWARILTLSANNSAAAMAYAITAGKLSAYPAGAFEAKSRTVDGESRVYARYVGGAQ
jgi:hypothetical protein